jgi:hypothetical protein
MRARNNFKAYTACSGRRVRFVYSVGNCLMFRKLTVFPAVYGILLAGAVSGQSTRTFDTGTRTLKGTVLDTSGHPIIGAVVLLKDTKTLQVRSYLTRDEGEYHFFGLSPNDEYEIRAQRGELASNSKLLSSFDNRKEAKIDLKLK